MPKFVLIDHSLKNLGGHHYPYAYSVLEAAQHLGWQPILATNRSFAEQSTLPGSWRVHTLFAHASYSRYTLDTQAMNHGWRPLRRWWHSRMRARLAADFAQDCTRLFELEPLTEDDVVFAATVSELDLAGLTHFLGHSTVGIDCDWHAQFHFGLFEGREPDYAAQTAAAAAMRASLEKSLWQSARQRIYLFCTTEQLSAQYRQLDVAPFATLPYPVHALFRPRAAPATARLRIACLGHSRREKGYRELPQILRQLWGDWFGPGRAQLVLQTHRGRQQRALKILVAELASTHTTDAPDALASKALDFADFPLPLERYAELLCGADIGLLLYDATRYYARCSGVLLEMLCAGIPVLVPAGGWLAAQIESENQRYLDEIATQAAPAVPFPADGLFSIPEGGRSLLLTCQWNPAANAGEYLRLELECLDATGTPKRAAAIVGARQSGLPVRCLFRVAPGSHRVRALLSNAWQQGTAPAVSVEWSTLQTAPPLGALGLTIAEAREIPRLLQELLEHFDHYRQRTRAHAAAFAEAHSGNQVLAGLQARATTRIARRIAGPMTST